MRASLTFVVIAVTVLSVGCSGPASPASPTVASFSAAPAASRAPATAAPHGVPLKGTLDGAYTLSFPGPSTLAVTGEGSGNATQFGRFTFAYDEVVDLSTGTGTGTYTFATANGDTLTAHWTGLGFPTADPDVLAIVENARITGGTGRFADARGSFRVDRLFNFVTSSGAGSFDGTIYLR